ncbi:hypothetical protein AAF712_004690 [Marasmius tenuissimus]|uniref:Uncharacterized protein n=1 Tax=Marasmius tenuissimus TaxID=585030 RepID=A0ABR3A3X9_9AGAR
MPAAKLFKASLLLWAPVILQSSLVGAQIHATCTNSSFAWSFNSMRQSPCEIGESLGRVCRSGTSSLVRLVDSGTHNFSMLEVFTIQPLQEGYYYSGINPPSVTPCVCNTVYYTLLSVCGLCQGGSAEKFDLWSENCTSTSTTFPETIPMGVNVPNYAFLPLDRTNQTVDLNRLRADNGPESIGRGPTSSRTSGAFGPTGTLRSGGGGSSSSFDDEVEKEAKKAGIIAGVVVAVVYILWAIGAGVIYWICRRQSRRRWGDPSKMYQNTGPSLMGPGGANTMGAYAAVPPGPPTSPNEKVYDPNDPSTYPQTPQTLGYQQPGYQQPYTPDQTSMMSSQPATPNAYSTTAFPQQQQQQHQAFSVSPDRNFAVTSPGVAAPMMNPYQHQAAMPMVSYDHTGSTLAPNRFSTPPLQQPEPHRQAYMSGVPQV